MKLRLLLLLPLLYLLSCNPATDAETTAKEPAAEETTQVQAPAPVAPDAKLPMETDLYTIKVLNDSIKSPRKELSGKLGEAMVTINYGSPAVNGRSIYGDLVPYGKVWRTGANEATSITLDAPLTVGEATVPAGKYALFTEPADKMNWTIIFNEVSDQWGAYDYDAAKDVARIAAVATEVKENAERMEFIITDAGLEMHWADLVVTLPMGS